MKNLFLKLSSFFKNHLDEIILAIGVILISFLSFAIGYIVAKEQEKKPLKFENLREEINFNFPEK